MNNKLIKTDGIWYKIKKMLYKLFQKREKLEIYNIEGPITKEKKAFLDEISYREEIKESDRKNKIADRLLNTELEICDLSEDEIDEMIEYFKKDIQKQDEKINLIKKQIIEMRNKLKNNM